MEKDWSYSNPLLSRFSQNVSILGTSSVHQGQAPCEPQKHSPSLLLSPGEALSSPPHPILLGEALCLARAAAAPRKGSEHPWGWSRTLNQPRAVPGSPLLETHPEYSPPAASACCSSCGAQQAAPGLGISAEPPGFYKVMGSQNGLGWRGLRDHQIPAIPFHHTRLLPALSKLTLNTEFPLIIPLLPKPAELKSLFYHLP